MPNGKVGLITASAVVIAMSTYNNLPASEVEDLELNNKWKLNWKSKLGLYSKYHEWKAKNKGKLLRKYRSRTKRLRAFLSSIKAKARAKGRKIILKLNRFADMDEDDVMYTIADFLANSTELSKTFPMNLLEDAVEASINWWDTGPQEPVADQGWCGSSWASNTVQIASFIYERALKKKLSFSTQQLVDCVSPYAGCRNGAYLEGFKFIVKNLLAQSSDYPYTGKPGACNFVATKIKFGVDLNYGYIEPGEASLMRAVSVAPVASSMTLGREVLLYDGGVFDPRGMDCGWEFKRTSILVVGYGVDAATGVKYWLLKNSWSKNWGENGYMRIIRGKFVEDGPCGLAKYPFLVDVKKKGD